MSTYIDGEPASTTLGGDASTVVIHKIGYGSMMMTWTSHPTPDEQAFEAIKTAIDTVGKGQKLFLNAGEFYGVDPREANLFLMARFFAQYPELTDRVFLSVKGGLKADSLEPDSGEPNLRRSVDTILKALDGKKKIDLFEPARLDGKIPVEEVVATLKQLQSEGKFDHIGLSEVSAATLERATKVHGIAAVEIEVSPWSYEEETKKVLALARKLNIPVIAYSPLGRGFLTGKLKREDLPEGDFRRHIARFQEDAQIHNQKIVDALSAISQKKGVSSAQLSIAWVSSLGPNVVPIPGSSKASRVKENFAASSIKFTDEELKEIQGVIDAFEVTGERGGKAEHLWG